MSERCYVCEGTEPYYMSKRCEKHDVCLTCGKKRKDLTGYPWGHKGGFVCQDCEEKRRADKIEKFAKENENEEDFYDDNVSICPYCGHGNTDDDGAEEYHMDGDYEMVCGECDSEYSMSTRISYSYTTSKKEK